MGSRRFPTRPGRPSLVGLVVGGVLLSGCTGDSDAAPDPDALAAETASHILTVTEGIEYGTAEVAAPEPGTVPLLLDLYVPPGEATEPRPVVIVLHGGGFTQQSRTDLNIVDICRALAAQGVVAASIDYRLMPQEPVPSARVEPLVASLPDQPLFTAMATAVDDTLTAVDHLTANAEELGIDPDRMGIVGSSAGAITADHVGYVLDDHGIDGPRFAFVASLWGGVFVPPPPELGDTGADQLEAGEPPLFAVHGDADERVPVALDDQLVEQAGAVGVTSEYHRVTGGTHGYDGAQFFTAEVGEGDTPFDRLLAFADEQLG